MLIEFNFENFRSIKTEQNFSMEALSTKNKEVNTFEVETAAPQPYKLLKSAVVYGANGSGKTNFVRALYSLRRFVTTSGQTIASHEINSYDPFELDEGYENKPTKFKITFIAKDLIKYTYEINYGRNEVFLERLEFYPNNKAAVLFERESNETEIHDVLFGKLLKNKRIPKTIFKNQLYLSKFGTSEPHEHLTQIFKYFDEIEISAGMDRSEVSLISKRIAHYMTRPENKYFAAKLGLLMQMADERIEEIFIDSGDDKTSEQEKSERNYRKDLGYRSNARAMSKHILYRKDIPIGHVDFDLLKKESTGTNILFALGGLILQTLEKGGIFISDEFNLGLHPKLSTYLVKLFHRPDTNPNNAQIIFNTHDIAFLDKEMFRSDQIWFVEKSLYGDSQLYSAQDFDGVRDDIPFDKWYMAGKFDAIPVLNDSNQLSTNESR